MAGMLGGILGKESEQPELEAPEGLATSAAFAIAMAVNIAGSAEGVARKTEIFLEKQAQLLETQNNHLKDEHELRLADLRNRIGEQAIRRQGMRVRVTAQYIFASLGVLLCVGLIVMVYNAFHSRNVIIDPFEIASGLNAPAPSGKIVAAELLDRLTQLQAGTRTSAQKRGLSNAWDNEISIQVPQTGLSIGQIENFLKTHFGHDQHIDGELVKTDTGALVLTVRGTGILARRFTDVAGQIDAPVNAAAEYIYGESEPGLFAKYLSDIARNDEAIAFAKAHFSKASVEDQPILLNYWANAITFKALANANLEALALYQEAIRIKPDYWIGYNNSLLALSNLGREEELVQLANRMITIAGGRPGHAPDEMYQPFDLAVFNLEAERRGALADMASTDGGTLTAQSGAEGLSVALLDVMLHDVAAARLRFQTTVWDQSSHPDAANAAVAQAFLEKELDNLPAAAKRWDEFALLYADPVIATSIAAAICSAAPVYEKTGEPQKADAALNAVGPLTFLDCYRYKADVLDMRGNWVGAQEWYTKAVKLAPSLPAGYYSWGLALAKHGEFSAAIDQLRLANLKAPTWADPLKAWGDVLVGQGHAEEGLAKYDEALKFAPNWKELKDSRDAIAKKKANRSQISAG
jgi:tetratricopeptide (TPR) repeat protein